MSELLDITKTFIYSKLVEIISAQTILIFLGLIFAVLLVKVIINDNLD